jgi:hypothetical protein
MSQRKLFLVMAGAAIAAASVGGLSSEVRPGSRVVMDAHNCYPYDGRWADRIQRALSAGVPLAIEQDLLWYTDKATRQSRSIVSHGPPAHGTEPSMKQYFFERVRPIVEQALRNGNDGSWPLITLNLDFKSDEAEHLASVWALLGEYADWLCTVPRTEDISKMEPLDVKPVLVLTGDSDAHQQVFYEQVPIGERLRVFGAAHVNDQNPMAAPGVLVAQPANNYRRWWNNSWDVVENGGQRKAGAWTAKDAARLKALVEHAHENKYWIRFYTLDGCRNTDLERNGWSRGYNFGSRVAVMERWGAANTAGVDYIATDQYEDLAAFLKRSNASHSVLDDLFR